MPSSDSLPLKGAYTLVICLEKATRIKVQGLGSFLLQKGYYAYTGSALGDGGVSLPNRVSRHLEKTKVKHWHIDFLVANKNATVITVVATQSNVNIECQINEAIKNIEGAMVPVVGFGASDCKHNCGSHLVYFGDKNATDKIADKYKDLSGTGAAPMTLEGRHINCK